MKCLKTLPALFFLVCCTALIAQQPQPANTETYSRLRIYLDSPNTLTELAQLGLAVDHGEREGTQSFIGEFSRSEIKLLGKNYRYEVLVEDLETYYADRLKADLKTPKMMCRKEARSPAILLRPPTSIPALWAGI